MLHSTIGTVEASQFTKPRTLRVPTRPLGAASLPRVILELGRLDSLAAMDKPGSAGLVLAAVHDEVPWTRIDAIMLFTLEDSIVPAAILAFGEAAAARLHASTLPGFLLRVKPRIHMENVPAARRGLLSHLEVMS